MKPYLIALIILVEVIFGVLYAFNTPRWQAPDEPAQFNYVRHIADTGTLPVLQQGDFDEAFLEKIKAERFPPDASIDGIQYESYEPPLYYVVATPIYLAARASGLDTVVALRLLSVALGAVLLLIAYRLFDHLFPSEPTLVLAGIAFMATVPVHIAMSAAINADTFAEVLGTGIILIAIKRMEGRLTDRSFILFGGILYGLILLTSIKIYASGLLLLLAEWRSRGGNVQAKGLRAPILTFGLSLLLSIWWFVRNALLYGGGDFLGIARHDAVVIGQQTTYEWVAQYGLKKTLLDFSGTTYRSFWAQFGWMGVLVDDRIYVSLLLFSVIAAVGVLLLIFRVARRAERKSDGILWTWVLLGVWLLVVLVDYVLYNLKYFQPQGRYLFPALVPIAALAVIGLYEVFEKQYVRLIFGLLYLAMLGLDYVSLFWFIIPQLRV